MTEAIEKPAAVEIATLVMNRIGNLIGTTPAPSVEIIVAAEAWHALSRQLEHYFGAEFVRECRGADDDVFWYGYCAFRRGAL